ncbi:MAG TPA: alanine racemase, partial [Verrucomicrobiae bacterium]
MSADWYRLANEADVVSPSLLFYPDRIRENIRRMITMAGGAARLRPHMKTHKTPEVIRLQLDQGIRKFKSATIAEAEMTAAAGAEEVLLAYPPVGPNVARFVKLLQTFPKTRFATVADNEPMLRALSQAATAARLTFEILIDIDCGMHRTGIGPGPHVAELYHLLASLPGLKAGGLHAYDGHIHHHELAEREQAVEAAYAPVDALHAEL